MSLAGFLNWLILRKTTTVHRKVVEANQFPLTGKTRGAKAFRWSFSLWRQFLKLWKEKNKQNRILITNTSTATPEPDQTSRDSHPGIYIRLLIKSHFLTFSYTASHLPLEFTVGVLPPLFLWTQRAVISGRHHGTLGKKEGKPQQEEETHRGVHVSWRVAVGVCQHGDNTNHDCLYRVDGKPTLLWLFITKLVFSGLVQNWDANVPVLCNCGEQEAKLYSKCTHVQCF